MAPFECNPGPESMGIKCKKNEFGTGMYNSFAFDHGNRRWIPDQYFSYPRIGAFEVFVKKGRQRIEVFSKLKRMKWPNPDWLLAAIEQAVEDELRALLQKKCSTLAAAFRKFDRNADGVVNKG